MSDYLIWVVENIETEVGHELDWEEVMEFCMTHKIPERYSMREFLVATRKAQAV